MWLYHLGALLKVIVGCVILISIYLTINPHEDPSIALGFGFLGIFVISWGVSFYIFYLIQYIATHKNSFNAAKDSYKLSLLFGMYVLSNMVLLLTGNWNKQWGILLFIIFLGLQIFLSLTPSHDGGHEHD